MEKKQILDQIKQKGIGPSNKANLRQIMLEGPPPHQRKKLWLEITGASSHIKENPSYYERLIKEKELKETAYTRQIERDLHRTFPEDLYFARERNMDSMRRILTAYSWRNPNIGYCQGMNFIAGTLLNVGFNEEEAFWMLTQIIEVYLPLDYFSVMSGVIVDQKIFSFLLTTLIPKVAKHLKKIELDPSLFSVQWFVCMFAYSFERDVVVRIWDIFFVEGSVFLFKVALGIMKLAQDIIINIDDFRKGYVDDEMHFIENYTKSVHDPDTLIEAASFKGFKLRWRRLERLRIRFKAEVDAELDKQTQIYIDQRHLDKSYLLKSLFKKCLNPEECRLKCRRTSSFFTFYSGHMQIIDNYVDDVCVPNYFNTKELRLTSQGLMLGQKNHICTLEEDQECNSEDEEVNDNFTNLLTRDESLRDSVSILIPSIQEESFRRKLERMSSNYNSMIVIGQLRKH